MGCHSLLQGIFPAQGWNPHLYHCATWETLVPTWIRYLSMPDTTLSLVKVFFETLLSKKKTKLSTRAQEVPSLLVQVSFQEASFPPVGSRDPLFSEVHVSSAVRPLPQRLVEPPGAFRTTPASCDLSSFRFSPLTCPSTDSAPCSLSRSLSVHSPHRALGNLTALLSLKKRRRKRFCIDCAGSLLSPRDLSLQ